MPPGTPWRGDTRKISDHRRAGCHTDMAVSTLTPLPPALPPAGPVMPATVPAGVPADGAGNRALGILLDDPGAGRPVHVEHIPARAGQEVPWPSWVPAPVADAFAARGIRAPWTSPGAGGGPRAGRPERDHLHRGGVRQVPRVLAARAHRGAGGRHRALRHADQGAGRRSAPLDPRARPAGGTGGRLRRRFDPGRTGLGTQPRTVPAHHARHAAPGAAATAQPLVRVFQPAELRGGGRVPRVPGGVRLARGARAAAAAPGGGASRSR